MHPEEIARINRRYEERLDRYGADLRALASGTEDRRALRFGVLRAVGIAGGSTVLDIGCGFGDFYGYLSAAGVDVRYTGYDINPRLLDIARHRYPGGSFELKDIQEERFDRFDFVVSSSAFNLRLHSQDNYGFAAEMLGLAYAHARCGVAIDFLSTYADYQGGDAFHYEPERLFAVAKRLTKRVALRHDYPLFEFCLYLYPDFAGWRGGG